VRLFNENRLVILGAVLTLVSVVIGISVAGWGDGSGKPCAHFYAGERGSDMCADASGTVSMGNLTVSATSLAATDNGTGGLALCTSVTLTNDSVDQQDYSVADFKIQNPAGEMAPTTSGTLRTAGALGLGGTKTGTICDNRPLQRGLYALVYEPSVLGARRGVWLTQH